jgi:hypothetical protein
MKHRTNIWKEETFLPWERGFALQTAILNPVEGKRMQSSPEWLLALPFPRRKSRT